MITKNIWILIGGFLIGLPSASLAAVVKMDAPPKVEESTRDTDKAAIQAAASEADQWAAKHASHNTPKKAEEAAKESPKAASPVEPPAKADPVEAAKPAPPETPKPAPPPPPVIRRSGLNEMKGKLESKSYDPKTLRLSVEGGYNVEFTYDSKTLIVNGGKSISVDDLNYGDQIVIHYPGKELYAIDIDRLGVAPRPQ